MTLAKKQVAVFARTITREAEKLLADPALHLAPIGGVKLQGTFYSQKQLFAMQDALARWVLVFPESSFYENMKDALTLRWGKRRAYWLILEAIEGCVETFRAQLKNVLRTQSSQLMNAVCMFMLLPEQVARRWLWHENVDFQSLESFLRRLTPEQYARLAELYKLSVVEGRPDDELPCVREGTVNKLWRAFGLGAQEEPRMAPKSALAHNFFGFDMGFQLYPSLDHDKQAPSEIARQFLQSKSPYFSAIATEERGAFEVNKEAGGLYWYLYRTLRSNALYNSEAEVRLGKWICPWFWFTMFAWATFLFASPIAFAVAVWLGVTSSSLLSLVLVGALGAITPGFLLLYIAKKTFRHHAFGGDYWENVGGGIVILGIALVGAVVISLVAEYPTFWALAASLILLIPYMDRNHTGRFWEAPFFGKVLPLATLALFVNDLYRNTNVLEFLWGVVLWVAETLYDHRVTLGSILGLFAFYLGTYWVFRAFERSSKLKVSVAVEEASWETQAPLPVELDITTLDKRISMGLYGLALAYMVGAVYAVYAMSDLFELGRRMVILLSVVSASPLILMLWKSIMGKLGVREYSLVRYSKEYDLGNSTQKVIKEAIAGNPYWFDASGLLVNRQRLDKMLFRVYGLDSWGAFFLRVIASDEELERALAFLHGNLYGMFYESASERVARMIVSGATDETIERTLRDVETAKQLARRKVRERIKMLEEWFSLVGKKTMPILLGIWFVATWVPRMTWKGVYNGYLWWKAMNEACPLSPSHTRGILR